jgi:hypothetical protein
MFSFQAAIASWLAQYETEIPISCLAPQAKKAPVVQRRAPNLFCCFTIPVVTVSADGWKDDGEIRWL